MSGLQSAADLRQIHHVGFARGLQWIRCRVHQRIRGVAVDFLVVKKPKKSAKRVRISLLRTFLSLAGKSPIVRSGSAADWPQVSVPLKKSAENVCIITVRIKSPLRNSISKIC